MFYLFPHLRIRRTSHSTWEVGTHFQLNQILRHEVCCYPINLAFYFCGKSLGGKGK